MKSEIKYLMKYKKIFTADSYTICSGAELATFTVTPINTIFVINHSSVTEYKAVVQSGHARLEVKQSPIVVHRQFQKHLPKLRQLYQELFPPSDKMLAI